MPAMRDLRRGSGHGKLLLFGEHAAVYGHPACGITLPNELRVTISGGPASRWRIAEAARRPGGRQGREEAAAAPAPGAIAAAGGPLDLGREQRVLLEEFLARTEELLPPRARMRGRIAVDSDIPIGLGFGSSAAWCVAFVRAALGEESSSRETWELAHRAEGFFHGTPSGIDTGLAILGGLYAFAPAPPALPAARPLAGIPLHLLVGAVPRRDSARALIGRLKERIDAGEQEATGTVARLGAVSARAAEILDSGDAALLPELGRLANEAQADLSALGLSTEELDDVLAAGAEAGALGGKLSGAGGGGAFFLVFDDPERADRALEALGGGPRPEKVSQRSGLRLSRYSWLP